LPRCEWFYEHSRGPFSEPQRNSLSTPQVARVDLPWVVVNRTPPSAARLWQTRNHSVGKGERARLGRSVRRLAEQAGRQNPLTEWWDKVNVASTSAGRRRQRSRRPRSPRQLHRSSLAWRHQRLRPEYQCPDRESQS